MSRGVLVGCDQNQEWMLSWWLSHFRKHNKMSVAFADMGMSAEARSWCSTRGKVVSLDSPKDFVLPKQLINKELIAEWEKKYGDGLWKSRSQWFRKPFAMLQSPFEETIWLDLDCEVIAPISHLFSKIHNHSGIALARDPIPFVEEAGYNSGVIAYQRNSPLLARWAQASLELNDRFLGDQDILSFLIHSENIEIAELSDNYNWQFRCGVNLDAAILHWIGAWGKAVIRRQCLANML